MEIPKIPTSSVIQSVMDHVRTLKVPTSDPYLLPYWRPTPFDRAVLMRDHDKVPTVQYSSTVLYRARTRRIKSINNSRDPCCAYFQLFCTLCIPALPSLAVGTPESAQVRGPTPGIFSIISLDPV